MARDFVRANAKAIAAFVAPFIAAAVIAGLNAIGADVGVDALSVETFIVGVLAAVLTWFTRNTTTPEG